MTPNNMGTYPNPYQGSVYNPSSTLYPQIQQPPMLRNFSTPQTPTQPPAPMPQPSPITGRVVNSLNDVFPNDVPGDGTVALFPQSDYSVIYAKQWNTDGSISTIKYVPEVQNEATNEQQVGGVAMTDIMDQLNNIEDLVKNIRQPRYNNQNHQKKYKYDKDRNAKVNDSGQEEA